MEVEMLTLKVDIELEYLDKSRPDNSFESYEKICHMMIDFSNPARILAGMALSNPIEVIGTNSPKHARGILFRKMREDGHSWPKIWGAFQEVKEALR